MSKPSDQYQQPITLLQLTDMHFMSTLGATLQDIDTALYFHKTLDYALSQHPDAKLILLTGDLAEEPGVASYQYLADILFQYDVKFCCLPGNHDDYPAMLKVLNQQNICCDKQLLLDNWQILMLNSQISGAAEGNLAESELEFLEQGLKQHQLHTVIAVHHHCISTGSQWMDTMLIQNSDELLSLLVQYPLVHAVIMGHIHQQLEQNIGKLRLLGTPSTCFQFKPLSDEFALGEKIPGYRWLKLYPNGAIQSEVDYLPERL